jgi:hypothetical protein
MAAPDPIKKSESSNWKDIVGIVERDEAYLSHKERLDLVSGILAQGVIQFLGEKRNRLKRRKTFKIRILPDPPRRFKIRMVC